METVEYGVAIRDSEFVQRVHDSEAFVAAESRPSLSGRITLGPKQAGKPIAGNRHDGFEEAGAGTQLTVGLVRHSQRKRGANG